MQRLIGNWSAANIQRDGDGEQRTCLVFPWGRDFIAQAHADCNIRPDFPRIVEVSCVAGISELCLRNLHGGFRALGIPEEEVGKRIASDELGSVSTSDRSRKWIKPKRSARELVTDLVVRIASNLTAKPEGVLPVDQ